MNRIAVPLRFVLAALLAASLSACSEDGPAAPEPGPAEVADAASLVAAHAAALAARDYDAYAALLHPDFEFTPQSEDLVDLPWVTPDSPWELDDELGMIGHMFDPSFVSDYDPSQPAVQSIQATITPLSEAATDEGTELTASAGIQVLWAANSGAFTAIRFVFTIVEDDQGQLRILRIDEHPDFSRLSIEESSWGSIKGLYR